MSTDTEIRTTMRHVADGVETPPIDELGFDRRVRRHRRRRRTNLAGATAAVAAVVLAVPLAVGQFASDAGSSEAPVASVPEPLPPIYFRLDDRVVMLDSDGTLDRLGLRADVIVGPTTEGVLVSDESSGRLIHVRTPDGGPPQHTRLPIGEVTSSAVSANGRQVAFTDPNGDVIVYDLVTEHRDRITHDQPGFVADFSDRLLYGSFSNFLRLGLGADAIDVPMSDPAGRLAFTGGNTVAVTSEESNVTTRVYDVATGSAEEIDELPGWWGDVSPDGRYFFGAHDEGARELIDLETDESDPVTGLEGDAAQISWLDQDTALVASMGVGRNGKQLNVLYACEAATQDCEEIYASGRDIRL